MMKYSIHRLFVFRIAPRFLYFFCVCEVFFTTTSFSLASTAKRFCNRHLCFNPMHLIYFLFLLLLLA